MLSLCGRWMSSAGRVRRFVILLPCVATLAVCGVVYLGYYCPERVCALSSSGRGVNEISGITNGNNNNSDVTSKANVLSQQQQQQLVFSHETDEDLGPDLGVKDKDSGSGSISITYDEIASHEANSQFDIRGHDVIVFLHIQKTGGTTFGRHLVHDLDLEKPCECTSRDDHPVKHNGRQQMQQQRKRCRCVRPNSSTSSWLFSRFSTGWQCGLHADWTELNACVDSALDRDERSLAHSRSNNNNDIDDDDVADMVDAEAWPSAIDGNPFEKRPGRRYFYVTLLRDPLVRFLSEFLHVQRGATWKTSRHVCGGREATRRELPPCYEGDDWEDVSLDEFMACPTNLAINRQTRMLADLQLIGCYNATHSRRRDHLMLESAKENLRRLAYYGLCEQQQLAQYMFEETFRVNFLTTFQQQNETHVTSALADVTPEQLRRLRQLNYLDVQLYEYASKLLAERFEALKRRDADFEEHFQGLQPRGTAAAAAAASASARQQRHETKIRPWEGSDSN